MTGQLSQSINDPKKNLPGQTKDADIESLLLTRIFDDSQGGYPVSRGLGGEQDKLSSFGTTRRRVTVFNKDIR